MAASAPRFVGLDVHKQSIVVSAVDAQQQIFLPARRVSLAEFESWATPHLLATDVVPLSRGIWKALASHTDSPLPGLAARGRQGIRSRIAWI